MAKVIKLPNTEELESLHAKLQSFQHIMHLIVELKVARLFDFNSEELAKVVRRYQELLGKSEN